MEYTAHPNSAKRITTSFASLRNFFQDVKVAEVTGIDIERYKAFRKTPPQRVKDVTLRNDLNALSLFFSFCVRAGWRSGNPLLGENKVKRPSGEDAVRMYIIGPEEEDAYFSVARRNKNLHDLAKLMILQGVRPSECLSAVKPLTVGTAGCFKSSEARLDQLDGN